MVIAVGLLLSHCLRSVLPVNSKIMAVSEVLSMLELDHIQSGSDLDDLYD